MTGSSTSSKRTGILLFAIAVSVAVLTFVLLEVLRLEVLIHQGREVTQS